ncbi:transporter substrate-binding domain-containing protein [Pararhodospirillum photometricum]|nr:transporter substrate-binding domain-containing protein [Pararhodospirillum photometricum]
MKRSRLARVAAAMVAVGGMAMAVAPARADATLDKIKERGKIAIGVDEAKPPYGSLDPKTGAIGGFQVALAQDLANRLGVDLEIVQVIAPTRVQFLQSGKVDLLIANMQWTQERSEALSYAPTPYDKVGGGLLTAKGNGITTWADLKGKVACISQGSNFAKPLAETYGAVVKGLRTVPDSLLALKGGSCDASVHNFPTLYDTVANDPTGEWTAFHLPTQEQLLSAFSVVWTRKGQTDTRAFADAAVREWLQSGVLERLAQEARIPGDYIPSATRAARAGAFDQAPAEPGAS